MLREGLIFAFVLCVAIPTVEGILGNWGRGRRWNGESPRLYVPQCTGRPK